MTVGYYGRRGSRSLVFSAQFLATLSLNLPFRQFALWLARNLAGIPEADMKTVRFLTVSRLRGWGEE